MSSTSEYEPDNEPTPSDEAVSSDEHPPAKRRKSRAVVNADDTHDADDVISPASSHARPPSVKVERSFSAVMPLTSNWEVNGDDDPDFEIVGVLGHTWERARALHREARHQASRTSGRASDRASDRENSIVTGRIQAVNGSQRRRFKNTKHKTMKEKVASRHDQTIVVETPRFGDDQVFATWNEFWTALNDFMATHLVCSASGHPRRRRRTTRSKCELVGAICFISIHESLLMLCFQQPGQRGLRIRSVRDPGGPLRDSSNGVLVHTWLS